MALARAANGVSRTEGLMLDLPDGQQSPRINQWKLFYRLFVFHDARFLRLFPDQLRPGIFRHRLESHVRPTRAAAFEPIRSLIDEIRLVPEAGALRVELRGELAGILALAADSNKPGNLSTAGLAEQIKMVAGIGFEPMTFRL
jgi:hypothetical protein